MQPSGKPTALDLFRLRNLLNLLNLRKLHNLRKKDLIP